MTAPTAWLVLLLGVLVLSLVAGVFLAAVIELEIANESALSVGTTGRDWELPLIAATAVGQSRPPEVREVEGAAGANPPTRPRGAHFGMGEGFRRVEGPSVDGSRGELQVAGEEATGFRTDLAAPLTRSGVTRSGDER